MVVTAPVATSTVNTDDRPSRSWCGWRLDVKAIRVPSGLQAGLLGVRPATSDGPRLVAASTSHRWASRSSMNPMPLYWYARRSM
jgi:hypothetical protein